MVSFLHLVHSLVIDPFKTLCLIERHLIIKIINGNLINDLEYIYLLDSLINSFGVVNEICELLMSLMRNEAFLLINLVIFGLGNNLFGIFQTEPMYNYPYFLGFWTLGFYTLICGIYVLYALKNNYVTQEMTEIPKIKFAVMGSLDSISAIMGLFGTNYIGKKSLVPLLQQSSIPISMLFNKLLIKDTKYENHHYAGATVVVLGLCTVLAPVIIEDKTTGNGLLIIFWSTVIIISRIPSVLSSVYKELCLNEQRLDTTYLNYWIAFFQSLIGIPMVIPSSLVAGLSLKDIPKNMGDGFLCTWGSNSILYQEDVNGTDITPDRPDDCGTAPIYINLYIAFNFFYNIFLISTIKNKGTNSLWIALTVIVPLSQIVLWIPKTPGHVKPSVFDILGFFILLTGLMIYRFGDKFVSKTSQGEPLLGS